MGCQSKNKTPKQHLVASEKKETITTPFEQGKQLFNGKGNCSSCHHTHKNGVGPSILAIAKSYKEQQQSILRFLKQESEPIVKPEAYAIMKANFALLKTFKEQELKALETYMLELRE